MASKSNSKSGKAGSQSGARKPAKARSRSGARKPAKARSRSGTRKPAKARSRSGTRKPAKARSQTSSSNSTQGDGYEWDVFLSYKTDTVAHKWIANHLHPLLSKWLPEAFPAGWRPKIFIDREIEVGKQWPDALEQALLRSRCMLAVWSPTYFSSAWCAAELETMRRRERHAKAGPLVYPLLFADGEHLDSSKEQYRDMKKWNNDEPSFASTVEYAGLVREVQLIAQELYKMARNAPTWKSGWPVVRPPPASSRPLGVPRLT
jgi:hypothetical protein